MIPRAFRALSLQGRQGFRPTRGKTPLAKPVDSPNRGDRMRLAGRIVLLAACLIPTSAFLVPSRPCVQRGGKLSALSGFGNPKDNLGPSERAQRSLDRDEGIGMSCQTVTMFGV